MSLTTASTVECNGGADDGSKAVSDSPPAESQTQVSPSDAKRASFYVDGVWEAMSEVRNGVVRIGEEFSRGEKRKRLELYYAFDYVSGNLRFDTKLIESTFEIPVARRRLERAAFMQYARNRDEVLEHEADLKGRPVFVNRYPRDHKFLVAWAAPLNMRMLPILSRDLWRAHPDSYNLKDVMRGLFRRFAATSPNSAEFGKRITRLMWIMKAPPSYFRYILEFDRKQGNRIIKLERSIRPLTGGKWRVEDDTQTKWKQINRTWVPTKITAKTTIVPGASELRLNWESVNTGISEKVFQMEGLKLPKRTKIMNYKLGKPIQEGLVGEDTSTLADSTEGLSGRFKWLMAINATLLLAIVAVVWWRRRVRTNKTPATTSGPSST
jgi:hypothetical protein